MDEKTDKLHINDEVQKSANHAESEVQAKRPKKKKALVIVAVTLAVFVLAGSGFFVWHEQPSFCNAICHEPMDDYVESYYGNDPNLMVSAHAQENITCLECHEAKLSDQVGMALSWVEGGYAMPLDDIHYDESFCLNENCHNMTRDELRAVFEEQVRNPHDSPHGEVACENCHYSHTQSVSFCSQCHDDAVIPKGWLSAQEAAEMGVRDYLDIQPRDYISV